MAVLLKTTEVYRVNTEEEVAALIEDVKAHATNYSLVSHSSKYKEKKKKGVVTHVGYEVKIGKEFETFWGDED